MMIQSALYGMGLALGLSRLVRPYIESGALVELCGPPIEAPESYFVAVAPGSEKKPETQAFLKWLRAESADRTARKTPQTPESAVIINFPRAS